ncbi:MAG: dienelactone hydrolase family protein [Actinomycetota bacterium]
MGQLIEFSSSVGTCSGYLAAPDNKGPAVVVIQEWWGLVDHIKDVCDRLAAQGFVALAPDLYHGATTVEPDEAGKMLMQLKIDGAIEDMSGAVKYLRSSPAVDPVKVGCIGFCMGGGLSLTLSAVAHIDAAVVYYGLPSRSPDYSNIKGAVLGHYADHDDWASGDRATQLFDDLSSQGVDAQMYVYPDTSHAFFNDSRPEAYADEAAKLSWERTLSFFRKHLA